MSPRRWRYGLILLLGGLIAADWDAGACPECFHEGYQIEMSLVSLLSAPPPTVLFSGYRDGHCQDDLVCTESSDIVWLGDLGKANSFNWWNSCSKREMVVFAGGHAPKPLHPDSGDVPPLKPELGDPKKLELAIWVEGENPALAGDPAAKARVANAESEVGETRDLFDALGTGIKLDFAVHPLPWDLPDPVRGILDDATCDLAEAVMNGLPDGGNMAAMQDASRLNVYFVRKIHYYLDGLTCYGNKNPNETRYVIFVSDMGYTPATLAHELGHALGLSVKATLPDGSLASDDVNELHLDRYLPVDNLMYSGVGLVGQITVGEIYRMHFDKRSWLWRGGTSTGDYPRECQASPVESGLCPPLTLHPTRSWP